MPLPAPVTTATRPSSRHAEAAERSPTEDRADRLDARRCRLHVVGAHPVEDGAPVPDQPVTIDAHQLVDVAQAAAAQARLAGRPVDEVGEAVRLGEAAIAVDARGV